MKNLQRSGGRQRVLDEKLRNDSSGRIRRDGGYGPTSYIPFKGNSS
jgi:hypothetical protein